MIARVLAWLGGGSIAWYVAGALALAGLGYVAASQVVLHNRQLALDRTADLAERLAADKAILQRQVDDVTRLNTENLAELGRLRAAHARDMADIEAELGRAKKAGQKLVVVYQEAARDPDAKSLLADACPAADRYLDRLRRQAAGGAAATDRHQDRAGAGRAPGRPADVPGRAPGPATAGDRRG
ncbi:MAG: hypothetical protein AB7P02_19310 [Alphaproteobacteria bacterium]